MAREKNRTEWELGRWPRCVNSTIVIFTGCKAWFSLAHKHKHKHKDIRTRRMAYLTQFSIPALLNPMINKMADEASAICFWFVRMRSGSKWPMIGPRPCASAYADPVFTSQSYDISISARTRRTKLSVFLVLMLKLMCSCVDPVFTCLHTCLCLCLRLCLCASKNQA